LLVGPLVIPGYPVRTGDRRSRSEMPGSQGSTISAHPSSGIRPRCPSEIGARSGQRPPAAPSGRPVPTSGASAGVPLQLCIGNRFRVRNGLPRSGARLGQGFRLEQRESRLPSHWHSSGEQRRASHRDADVSPRCSEQSRRKAATQSHGAVAINDRQAGRAASGI
jgi:hypothetical protein